MRIKWKFEEEREEYDKDGNLKNYYQDTEPWKKVSKKPNVLLQIGLVIIAFAVCLAVIDIAFSLSGFNWSDTYIVRYMRDRALQNN